MQNGSRIPVEISPTDKWVVWPYRSPRGKSGILLACGISYGPQDNIGERAAQALAYPIIPLVILSARLANLRATGLGTVWGWGEGMTIRPS